MNVLENELAEEVGDLRVKDVLREMMLSQGRDVQPATWPPRLNSPQWGSRLYPSPLQSFPSQDFPLGPHG